MDRVSYRSNTSVKLANRNRKGRRLPPVVLAVLLIVLAVFISGAAAQKSGDPPVRDPAPRPANVPPMNEEDNTQEITPQVFWQYTITLAANCSLDPLRAFLDDLLAVGHVREAPIQKDFELRIAVDKGQLRDLATVPCVEEITAGWEIPLDPAQPDALTQNLESEVHRAPEGATEETADAAGTGGIRGTVTDENGGLPLPDITVEVYNYPGPGTGWSLVGTDDTLSDGAFFIDGLVSGLYRIGFFDLISGTYVAEFFDNVFDINNGSDITVSDGVPTENINAELSESGQISGTVTAADTGDPLDGIHVTAYRQYNGGWEEVDSSYTISDGTYVINGLLSGTYHVYVADYSGQYLSEYIDGAEDIESGADVTITGGVTTPNVNATLETAGHITGTITAEDGITPIQTVNVTARVFNGFDWDYAGYGSTDLNGFYDVGGLRTGTYRLEFDDWSGDNIDEYFDDAPDLYSATDISVTTGIVTPGKDAQLAAAARISGTVTDGVDPISVWVYLYMFNGSSWDQINYDYVWMDGTYSFGGLAAGTYRLEFRDVNDIYVSEYYDDAPNFDSATEIVLTTGEHAADTNAELALAGHITGVVTAEDGDSPLQNISVEAYQYNGSWWDSVGYDTTGSDGSYDITGLAPGTYRLGFFDWYSGAYLGEYYDDAPDLSSATDIPVAVGEVVSGKNAALAAAGHITGTVVAEDDGAPLHGIYADAYISTNGSWTYIADGYTDADGNYDIDALSAGTYRVHFRDWDYEVYATEYYDNELVLDRADDIPLQAGQTAAGVDAALSIPGHITGTVTDESSGAPLPGISVYAYLWDGVTSSYAGTQDNTDSSGNYDLDGLGPGDYVVWFWDWNDIYLEEKYDNVHDLNAATQISVNAGADITGVDAALAPPSHITGTLTAEDGGTPLADIDVCIYFDDGSNWEYDRCILTDVNGNYDISELVPGTYRLQFWDGQGAYVAEFYDDAADLDSGSNISVTGGSDVNGVDAALATAGHISGTVTADDGGAPLIDIQVCARFYNGSHWQSSGVCDNTDANGHYDMGGLVSGSYRLRFRDWGGAYVTEYYDDSAFIEDGDDIPVTAGLTTPNINASLAAAGYITGTASADDGAAPLPDIDVCALFYDGSSWQYAGLCGYTNAAGQYEIGGLVAGSYRLKFQDWQDSYRTQYYDNAFSIEMGDDVAVTAEATTPDINAALALNGASPFTSCVSNTGSDASIAVPDTVTVLGGLTLESGDEFALYTPDGQICAGHGKWTASSLGLTAWGDNTQTAEKDGFAAGGEMGWAFWDASANQIHHPLVVTYSSGDGLYAEDSFHIVDSINQQVTQYISLSAGWNMVSSNVDPKYPAMETLLADIASDLVLLKNGDGDVYWPAQTINYIGDWDVRDGYQIYMENSAVLSITGGSVDPAQTPIDLPAGWSLVAYLRNSPMSVDEALDSINAELVLAKNGDGQVYWPEYSVSQIGDMQLSEGYQVYLDTQSIQTYPAN